MQKEVRDGNLVFKEPPLDPGPSTSPHVKTRCCFMMRVLRSASVFLHVACSCYWFPSPASALKLTHPHIHSLNMLLTGMDLFERLSQRRHTNILCWLPYTQSGRFRKITDLYKIEKHKRWHWTGLAHGIFSKIRSAFQQSKQIIYKSSKNTSGSLFAVISMNFGSPINSFLGFVAWEMEFQTFSKTPDHHIPHVPLNPTHIMELLTWSISVLLVLFFVKRITLCYLY
jgi:hypothetical protein